MGHGAEFEPQSGEAEARWADHKKVFVLCSRPRQNVKWGSFTWSSRNDDKEMYKMFLFLPFSLPSPSSLLKLPGDDVENTDGHMMKMLWMEWHDCDHDMDIMNIVMMSEQRLLVYLHKNNGKEALLQ